MVGPLHGESLAAGERVRSNRTPGLMLTLPMLLCFRNKHLPMVEGGGEQRKINYGGLEALSRTIKTFLIKRCCTTK